MWPGGFCARRTWLPSRERDLAPVITSAFRTRLRGPSLIAASSACGSFSRHSSYYAVSPVESSKIRHDSGTGGTRKFLSVIREGRSFGERPFLVDASLEWKVSIHS